MLSRGAIDRARPKKRNPEGVALQFFLSIVAGVVTSVTTVLIINELSKANVIKPGAPAIPTPVAPGQSQV